jgi:hypothetical protein
VDTLLLFPSNADCTTFVNNLAKFCRRTGIWKLKGRLAHGEDMYRAVTYYQGAMIFVSEDVTGQPNTEYIPIPLTVEQLQTPVPYFSAVIQAFTCRIRAFAVAEAKRSRVDNTMAALAATVGESPLPVSPRGALNVVYTISNSYDFFRVHVPEFPTAPPSPPLHESSDHIESTPISQGGFDSSTSSRESSPPSPITSYESLFPPPKSTFLTPMKRQRPE